MKRFIAWLICFSLIFSVLLPVSAADVNEAEPQGTTPFILVAGMNVLPLKLFEGEKEQQLWPMSGKTVAGLAAKLLFPLLRLCFTRNYNEFADKLFPVLNQGFDSIKCDDDGNSVAEVKVETFPEAMSSYPELYEGELKDEQGIVNAACSYFGAENVYFFNYDWRLDPLIIADELHALIEKAKQDSGSEKVMLACCSMGGTITMSYLYKYGSSSLKSISMLSTAFCGVEAVGDILSGDLELQKEPLIRRVVDLGKTTAKRKLFTVLMKAVDKAGIADFLVKIGNNTLDKLHDRIYDDFLKDCFGKMPGIWALLDRADFERAANFMLDEEINSQLIARTSFYLDNIQAHSSELLQAAKDNGTTVNIVCQYNLQPLPLTSKGNTNNDLLIDVRYASGGAIAADLGETLPEDYVQAVNDSHNHISADRVIDASTCMFPESTWFIKDQAHVDYNVGASTEFIFTLASSDAQLTVFDKPEYPQFMRFNADKNLLEELR